MSIRMYMRNESLRCRSDNGVHCSELIQLIGICELDISVGAHCETMMLSPWPDLRYHEMTRTCAALSCMVSVARARDFPLGTRAV